MKLLKSNWIIPLLLLITALLSFGALIPSMGFYWDDWPSLLIYDVQGMEGFQQFFSIDRPTTHWSYTFLLPLFGPNPVFWQLFSLGLRWISGILVWGFVRQMWPESNFLAILSALFFTVHPIFRQQSIALTYHQLWIEFVFFLISLWGMVNAARYPRQYWFWTTCAIAGLALNLLISEYFLGIELLRPVILWLALSAAAGRNTLSQLKFFLIHYLPYLIVFLVYLAWRFIFMDLPGADRNSLVLLSEFQSAPFPTLVKLIQMMLQDASYILLTNWYAVFQPSLLDFENRFLLFSWGIAFIVFLITAGFLLATQTSSDASIHRKQNITILLLGIIISVVGVLPAWVTGRQVIIGAWSDRLAVPVMLGASMAMAGLIVWIIRERIQIILLVSILIGLAVGNNLRVANDYRWAQIQINRFYWQMHWRVPAIEPSTAILAEAEILPKTGLYSTAAGLNILYAEPSPSGKLPYWFFSISREFRDRIPELVAGMPLQSSFRQFTFEGDSRNSLIVYYDPSKADCMRIITPQDAGDPDLSPLVLQTLSISNLNQIQADPINSRPPPTDIFGKQPEQGWCYYFQKADLARQSEDWAAVVELGDQAMASGFTPENSQSNTPQEWIPFIEGYAHASRWQDAIQLSDQALKIEPKMSVRVCTAWQGLINTVGAASSEAQGYYSGLGCE